ncbi:hypothetical protein D030_2660B, partial [Vibrio parahaemolyticus AQ3810]
YTNTTR